MDLVCITKLLYERERKHGCKTPLRFGNVLTMLLAWIMKTKKHILKSSPPPLSLSLYIYIYMNQKLWKERAFTLSYFNQSMSHALFIKYNMSDWFVRYGHQTTLTQYCILCTIFHQIIEPIIVLWYTFNCFEDSPDSLQCINLRQISKD